MARSQTFPTTTVSVLVGKLFQGLKPMLGKLSLVTGLCVLFTFFFLFIAIRSLDFTTNRSNSQLTATKFVASAISEPKMVDRKFILIHKPLKE